MQSLRLLASNISTEINDIISNTSAVESGGAFEGINNIVKSVGGGSYAVMRNIGIVVLILAIGVFALGLVLSAGDANKRSDKKSALPWIVIGTVLFFAAVGLIIGAANLGEGVEQELTNQTIGAFRMLSGIR